MAKDKKEVVSKANELLEKLRPHMHADNGDIEAVELKDDNVMIIKWLGACAVCERSELTLRYSVKEFLLENMPELSDVVSL